MKVLVTGANGFIGKNLVLRLREQPDTEVLSFGRGDSDAQLQAVRDAGYSESDIVEIVAHVAANIFTNYFNNLAGTVIDFPKVSANPLPLAA